MRLKLPVLLAVVVFCVLAAEGALRLIGKRPFEVRELNLRVDPEGPFFHVDTAVGYEHHAGRYRFTHGTGHVWVANNDEDLARLTEPRSTTEHSERRDEVWVFGCSITYGWSLDDEQTYAWLLQQQFPELRVLNFGVAGYGTINSLLQFEELIGSRPRRPRIAIVGYLSFHPRRNTMLRSRLKSVVRNASLDAHTGPYARLDGDGGLQLYNDTLGYYEPPLLRESALVHLVETVYNRYQARAEQSEDVSLLLFERFHEMAAAHGVRLVVVGLDPESLPMLARLRASGIETFEVGLDLERPGYRNLPHDRHPSARAHREYAAALGVLLESVRPAPGPQLR